MNPNHFISSWSVIRMILRLNKARLIHFFPVRKLCPFHENLTNKSTSRIEEKEYDNQINLLLYKKINKLLIK